MRTNLLNSRGRFVGCMVFFIISVLVLLPFMSVTCKAASGDNVVAEKYAPVLYFEKDEKCYPVSAQYAIDNSDLYNVSSEQPEVRDLSSVNWNNYTADVYYLDNQVGTINSDVSAYSTTGYAPTVYYKVHTADSSTVIQYWFFYSFNNGDLNKHEGDWEMIQVVLTNNEPSWVAYSQHHSGQWATWDQVEKDGDHIKDYVARGSHANYLRSYSGKLGIASDNVGDNGKVMRPGSYTLADLDDQAWLAFGGYWGEVGKGSVDAAASSSILGEAGPQGPMYREEGKMWKDPVGWGKGLPQANDMLFIVEWFLYNIIMLIIVITLIILAVTFALIYRRHKKYGLGPRKVSMLYIDGFNLKSIGNILCIVGIVIAIFGLFNTWYDVSYKFSSTGDLPSLNTAGWQSLLKIDGMNGVQIIVPGSNGPEPVGTFSIPFSLLFGISILFLIIATIGVFRSKKLGFKYIGKGIRFFIPIILIIVVLVVLPMLVPEDVVGQDYEGAKPKEIFNSISSSPFGNEKSFNFKYKEDTVERTATLDMKWGLGLGGILLLLGGIIMIVSGVFEIAARTQFFEPKTPIGKPPKEKKSKKDKEEIPKVPVPPPEEIGQPKDTTETTFCPECGNKLEKDAEFCPECGTKIK